MLMQKILKAIAYIFSYIKFKLHKIQRNSVFIVEPNPYHGEIIPGFIKYFQDLGYNVDLYWRYENNKTNSIKNLKNVNKFVFSPDLYKKILKDKKIKKYEYCFVSTTTYVKPDKTDVSFFDYLGYIPQTKHGVFIVEHNLKLCLERYNEGKYIRQGRLFTLSGFDGTPMLNPHYFKPDIKTHIKNKLTTFIIAGRFIKSETVFFDTINRLIAENINKFKVIIIGLEKRIPKNLEKYIKCTGFIKFPKMYKIIERCDFVLPLLNYEDEYQKKFLTESTTGARQLSLGFVKPLVINELFGHVYDFDDENSILYHKHDLFDAMKRAIELSNKDYILMCNNLEKLADNVYRKSLDNLREAMKNQ